MYCVFTKTMSYNEIQSFLSSDFATKMDYNDIILNSNFYIIFEFYTCNPVAGKQFSFFNSVKKSEKYHDQFNFQPAPLT